MQGGSWKQSGAARGWMLLHAKRCKDEFAHVSTGSAGSWAGAGAAWSVRVGKVAMHAASAFVWFPVRSLKWRKVTSLEWEMEGSFQGIIFLWKKYWSGFESHNPNTVKLCVLYSTFYFIKWVLLGGVKATSCNILHHNVRCCYFYL